MMISLILSKELPLSWNVLGICIKWIYNISPMGRMDITRLGASHCVELTMLDSDQYPKLEVKGYKVSFANFYKG